MTVRSSPHGVSTRGVRDARPTRSPPAQRRAAAGARTRMTASERTAQIADVAVALFGRGGFRGATTKAIARAAGVSEATIFKYFPTRRICMSRRFSGGRVRAPASS